MPEERQTADTILTAFKTMDVDILILLRTLDCKRVFFPSSLEYTPQTNNEYRDLLSSMKSVHPSFSVTRHVGQQRPGEHRHVCAGEGRHAN
jgi:hypothetical protein